MSTIVIVLIVVVVVVVIGALLASARRAKAERDLGQAQGEAKRDDVGFEREEAAELRAEADRHEERAARGERELESDG